ncbi:MAG: adenylate/guanylate cyclase domain-containing protein [Kiloniellales bacterium]|nr:adenylate/guanylate cyclase domain-containing protein [Kiloniellales bacterium]
MRGAYLIHLATVVVTVALLLLRFVDPSWVEILRLRIFDFYQQVQPRERVGDFPITIVDIDDRSLAEIGQWPWPRSVMAELVADLTARGAVVVGMNIVFPEPDRSSPAALARGLQGIDEELREELLALPSNDQVLASRLAQSRVVLGQWASLQPFAAETAAPPSKATFAIAGPESGARKAPQYFGLLRNLPMLEEAALGLGVIGSEAGPDGVQRRAAMLVQVGDELLPAFSVELLRVATGAGSILAKTDEDGFRAIGLSGVEIPTNRAGEIWIHFRPFDLKDYIPAVDVLSDRVDADQLSGHIVLIGTSAAGLFDLRTTPLSGVVPAVEIQAQLLETLLSGEFLERPEQAHTIELLAILASCLLVALLLRVAGAVWSFVGVLLLSAIYLGGSWLLFSQGNLLVSGTYPALSGFLLLAVLAYLSYLREQRSRHRVQAAFGHYLPEVLVDRLAQDPSALRVGGELREMSILFADIADMTIMSEAYAPQELVEHLNEILTSVTDCVDAHGGTLNKYMADSAMAFWNAPLEDPEHPRHACKAALDIQVALRRLEEVQRSRADQDGLIRFVPRVVIGINSGPCVVGNLGSARRVEYSAIGDSVNVAARLSWLGRSYTSDIVLGESTAAQVGDLALVELDLIALKGKSAPVRIYTLLGDEQLRETAEFQRLLHDHAEVLAAYRAQRWSDAQQRIEGQLTSEIVPDRLRPLYELYLHRIAEFRAEPPPADWDGVFHARVK